MRRRLLAGLWLLIGAAVWLGFFDLYVSRGAREYGQLRAEYELHWTKAEPAMAAVMARARHDGAVAASAWAGVIVLCGWGTTWLRSGARARSSARGSL
jgi:hypothetical protein